MVATDGAIEVLSTRLKLNKSDAEALAGARSASIVRNDDRAALTAAQSGAASRDAEAADDDFRPGYLRVRVLEAEGLPSRPGGAPCDPYVVVALCELTGRRARRTAARVGGAAPSWNESFDFDVRTCALAQVVVDVWDRSAAAGGEDDLMGKAVISLSECRPGMPHTFFKNLLEGRLVFRVLFDHAPLPSVDDEEAQYKQALGL